MDRICQDLAECHAMVVPTKVIQRSKSTNELNSLLVRRTADEPLIQALQIVHGKRGFDSPRRVCSEVPGGKTWNGSPD